MRSKWRINSSFSVLLLTCLLAATAAAQAVKNSAAVSNKTEACQITAAVVLEDGNQFENVYVLQSKEDCANIEKKEQDVFSYFCHKGIEASLPRFWSSMSFVLNIDSMDYWVYVGRNLSAVGAAHEESNYAWFYTQLPWKSKEFRFSPFEDTCLGLKTIHPYSINLQIKNVNYFMLLATVFGFAMYLMAPRLCRNQFFHFTTGIGAGIVLSVLILTFLLQKKLKVPLFSWIGLFYSLAVYFITSTWYNLKQYLAAEYFHWVVGYLLTSGLVSFALIYRMGPPSNPRTLNLIQWTMQAMSLLVIVLSSYFQTASMGLAILLVTWSCIPDKCKSAAKTQFRKRLFRPKIKLLSEDEYAAQANRETTKALEELRKFCQSPESKPWQMVRRLNSPNRFAEFIEGSPHITEEEILEFSHWDAPETDDEDGRLNLTDDEDEGSQTGDRSFDAQM